MFNPFNKPIKAVHGPYVRTYDDYLATVGRPLAARQLWNEERRLRRRT
jgi:hypothetical protein